MNDDTRRRYLLGLLDDEEADAVELAFLRDPDAFEALRIVEAELVEAWLSGALSAAEAAAFERRRAVVPGWDRQIALSRALEEHAAARPAPADAPGPGWWARLRAWLFPGSGTPGWAWAAAMVAVLAVGIVLWPGAGGVQVDVTLRPDALRSAEISPSLTLPADADTVTVHLEVELPDEFPSYRVELRTGAGSRWSAADLRPDPDGTVTAAIPAEHLTPGRYELALYGAHGAAEVPVAFYTLVVAAPR